MNLLKWLFSGPVLRGRILKKMNELIHQRLELERKLEIAREDLDVVEMNNLGELVQEVQKIYNILSGLLYPPA